MAGESDGEGGEDSTQEDVTNKASVVRRLIFSVLPAATTSAAPTPVQRGQTPSTLEQHSDITLDCTQSLEECRRPATAASNKSHDKSFSDDSRQGEEDPPSCKNGVMDLSRRGLTQLPRKFRKEYGCVKKLVISSNRFTNVAGFDMFKQCCQVDATDNQLHKLSSFLPLAKTLTALYLSNNAITNIDCMRVFVNLETLDVSCNDIENIPASLDNPRLSHWDLSSNSLTSLPDLSHLRSLTHLDISGNKISSFKTTVFPKRLLSLNVASNTIEDLTEFMRLLPLQKIESISLANNPCISKPTFDYRIYILSILTSLQDIDGFVVSEEEQLKGEWLYSQGKGRSFKPDTGVHEALVKYLERYCPFDVEGKLVSTLDQSVVKVMEKRREMMSNSGLDEDSSQSLSVHSPYGAWTAQLEGKENQIPSSSADESEISRRSFSARAPKTSTPSRDMSMTSRTASVFEPLSRTSTMDSVDSTSTVTLIPAAKRPEFVRSTPSTATTARADRSARFLRERPHQLDNDTSMDAEQTEVTQRSISRHERRTNEFDDQHHISGVMSSRSVCSRRSNERHFRRSPPAIATDISMDMSGQRFRARRDYDEESVVRRIMCLEENVSTLIEQNQNLTKINDELSHLLVEMTEKFKSEVRSLSAELTSLKSSPKPQPCNLHVSRQVDNGCYEIVWDLPMVKCYKVLTNGVESGVVRAPYNAARISDVEPDVELRIQLQAVHFDGTLGEPSEPLIIHSINMESP